MLIKIVLFALVLYMVVNLFLAMRVMIKNDHKKGPMSKYIGHRVLTSAIIVIVILGVRSYLKNKREIEKEKAEALR